MEREILFRGKQVDTGKWLQGFLSQSRNIQEKPAILKPCIDYEENGVMMFGMVDPKTVGQFTGLTDKNGNRIFEEDIVRVKKFNNDPIIGKVVFSKNTAGFEVWWNIVVGAYGEKATRKENFAVCGQMEVIGNIHDNPELLK